MTERGGVVDHSTLHRRSIKMLPTLAAKLRRRLRPFGRRWRMDETSVKISGQWKYLYRAVDLDGDTVDFLLRAKAKPRCVPGILRARHGPARRAREGHH